MPTTFFVAIGLAEWCDPSIAQKLLIFGNIKLLLKFGSLFLQHWATDSFTPFLHMAYPEHKGSLRIEVYDHLWLL